MSPTPAPAATPAAPDMPAAGQSYSYELTDEPSASGNTGGGLPRMHIMHRHEPQLTAQDSGVTSLAGFYARGMSIAGENAEFLGTRAMLDDGKTAGPYVWQSYRQAATRAANFGSGLAKVGGHKLGDRIAFYLHNCAEYIISFHTAFAHGYVMVPIYDTLGKDGAKHVLEECETETVVTSAALAPTIIQSAADKASVVKRIIIVTPAPTGKPSNPDADRETVDGLKAQAEQLGIGHVEILTFAEVEATGSQLPVVKPAQEPAADDVAIIAYTSGTSGGRPKGAILTHGNFLSVIAGGLLLYRKGYGLMITESPRSTSLSYLPLAHLYGQAFSFMSIAMGARMGFWQGDVLKLLDDMQALRPTCLTGIPRILNRVYAKIWAALADKGRVAQWLFNFAYASKLSALRQNGQNTHWLWDRIVFGKIRELLGGEVAYILNASAPLLPEVKAFYQVAFSSATFDVFGSTETCGVVTITSQGDTDVGHVGYPMPFNRVKLADVSDMGFTSQDKPYPRGEICVKGPTLFKGYYKQPNLTAEVMDADGYYHTGDIGLWDEMGRLRIIDRVKALVKLQQGEYLALERIENIINTHAIIQQSMVYGNSFKSFAVAVVVPDESALRRFVKEQEINLSPTTTSSFESLCRDQAVCAAMVKELDKWCRKQDCRGFEIPKMLYLEPAPFTIGNGILSPTMKLKRGFARNHYAAILEELYDNAGFD
ncbi:acetyl-CoA synthetase-like protein [Ramicandelaber brevisporus]|nr:acetyl-CoA synthetase-like protein [Ramicandelaber brevisporus]